MSKSALVTGATSGFGEAIATTFAKEGYSCIITGRREDRLLRLKEKLEADFNARILILSFDIRKKEEVEKAIAAIPPEWGCIDILVNNAGLASGRGTLDKGLTEDWDQMIDTNVKGMLYMTKAALPLLKMSKEPQIVNIGSIAGKETYLGGNVYCATKHAVDSLSQAMRIDFLPLGIKVTQICPGAAETEFSLVRFKGNKEEAKGVYRGFEPLYAEDIAETVLFAVTRPAHVCLNDIVIMPTAQANTSHLKRQDN